jgi:hypothetical protein
VPNPAEIFAGFVDLAIES